MVERLQSAREGNTEALKWARERYLRGARQWVRARLPKYLHHTFDIEPCIADAFSQALEHMDSLETSEGAFQLSLRQNLQAGIRALHNDKFGDETVTIEEIQSPLEGVIGPESCRRYESALNSVSGSDREAIVGRIEFGFGYRELAEMLGKPTPEAARAAVAEAVNRLVEVMCHER
jgi:DNA-directed RNA polymerase specialized sigma24 family protein